MSHTVIIGEGASMHVLASATTTDTGTTVRPISKDRTFQAIQTGGTSATVLIEASNDNVTFITLATISLTADSAGVASDAAWHYVRARISAIVGGSVDVFMGT